MGRPIVISVLGDTRDLVSKLGQGESRLGRFGKAAGTVGKAVAGGVALAGAAAVGLAVSAVKSASDSQQSLGATETVFGRYADKIVSNSQRASQSVGLSANQYRESANLIGSLFRNQGVAADKLAGQTDKMVRTGADLAATYGGTTKDAVEALGSAFKGEFDPLEKYGISIKQSTINAALAAKGEDKLTGSALKAAQQRATTALITKQAGGALGSFGRESNTLAGQQQRLGASWEDLKAKAGSALLPALTSVFGAVNSKVLPAISRLGGPTRRLAADWGGRLRGAFTAVKPVLDAAASTFTGTILPAISGLGRYLGSTLGPIFSSVFRILGTQVVPILVRFGTFLYGTVYPAVAKIVVQVGTALKPVFDQIASTVRTQVLPAVSSLLAAFSRAQPTIQKVIGVAIRVAGAVLKIGAVILARVLPPVIRLAGFLAGRLIRAIGGTISAVVGIIRTVVRFGTALVNGTRAVASFVSRVISFARSIPGRIRAALGNAAATLVNKGRDFILGLIRGITGKVGDVRAKVASLIGKARDALSGAGTALKNAGRSLIQGLINGIGEKIGEAIAKVRAGLQKIRDMLPGSPIKSGPLKSWNNGGAGKRLMVMLASGLAHTQPVETAMTKVAAAVARTPLSSAVQRPSLALAGGGLAGGGTTVNVTLEVPVGASAVDIGRQLQAFLDAYFGAGGRPKVVR